MKKLRRYALVVLTSGAIAFMGACGDSGGGGGSSCKAGSTCVQVGGTWTTVENVSTSAACGGTYTDYGSYTVTQTGCSLSVAPASGDGPFAGGINGSTICWTGSYPDSGGTTTITSLTLTLDQSGTSFQGTANWTWSDGSMSCSGTTSITGTKS